MITYRIARALVKMAARRWPERLREDVLREWSAELAILAREHQHGPMLRYAASLATHPSPRPALTGAQIASRAWSAARVLVVGPAICIGMTAGAFFGSSIATMLSALAPALSDFAIKAQLPLLSLLCIGGALLAGLIGRRWALNTGPALTVLVATGPGFLAAAMLLTVTGIDQAGRHLWVFEIYFAGFAAVLYAATRLVRSGRRRAGLRLAVIGALVVLDFAVMPSILAIQLEAPENIDGAYAVMWLPALLFDTGFGLPHPDPMEVFTITDVLVGVPQILLVLTGWATGIMLRRPVPEPIEQLA